MPQAEIKISLNQMVEEIERELHERGTRYPRDVSKKKLRQSVGKYQVERLKAALATLQFLQDHREAFLRYAKLFEVDIK